MLCLLPACLLSGAVSAPDRCPCSVLCLRFSLCWLPVRRPTSLCKQTITIPDPAAIKEAISTSELAELLASHLQQPGTATALLSSQLSEMLTQRALGRKGGK